MRRKKSTPPMAQTLLIKPHGRANDAARDGQLALKQRTHANRCHGRRNTADQTSFTCELMSHVVRHCQSNRGYMRRNVPRAAERIINTSRWKYTPLPWKSKPIAVGIGVHCDWDRDPLWWEPKPTVPETDVNCGGNRNTLWCKSGNNVVRIGVHRDPREHPMDQNTMRTRTHSAQNALWTRTPNGREPLAGKNALRTKPHCGHERIVDGNASWTRTACGRERIANENASRTRRHRGRESGLNASRARTHSG